MSEKIETPIGEADSLPESREKKTLVRLDGAALTVSGKEARVSFFKDLAEPLDDYKGVILTSEEAQKLANVMRKLRTGFQAGMPIRCAGAKVCPLRSVCPLVKLDQNNPDVLQNPKVPIGKLCPVESQLFAMWVEDYCDTLKVTPDDYLDMLLCKELAELDIYEFRVSVYLGESERATGIGQSVVGFDQEENTPIYMEQVSPAMELKLKIKDRRQKILESLVATRKEQYKKQAALSQAPTEDASNQLASLKNKLETALGERHPTIIVDTVQQNGVFVPIDK